MFYVYAYFYPNSEKPFYIGKGQAKRKNDHLFAAKRCAHSNKLLQNVINKIIVQGLNPRIEILQTFIDEDDAYNYEELLIAQYGRRLFEGGPLCNISSGGRGPKGVKHTEEAKEKMRGRIVSNETRALISHSRKGVKLTEEQKRSRKKVQPWNHSPDTISKMRKPKSKQHANAIKIAQSGDKCPRAKTWVLRSPENVLHSVISLKTFCQNHGLAEASLYRSLDKKVPVTKGKSKGWQVLSVSE